jgi:hypothetical protein
MTSIIYLITIYHSDGRVNKETLLEPCVKTKIDVYVDAMNNTTSSLIIAQLWG